MRNLGLAFSFPFKDPDWVSKVILGALFTFLSLFGFGIVILAGYFVQVTQRVMRKDAQTLPEWKDLGVMFILGFKYCIVYFLYILPILIMIIPIIPLGILSELSGQGEVFGIVLLIYTFGIMIVTTLYSILLALMIPIISYRFAERERISDALDIGEVFRHFGKNWQSAVVVVLISVGIQSIAGLGIVVFLIGILFTIFYAYLVSSYLSGILYLESQEKGSQA